MSTALPGPDRKTAIRDYKENARPMGVFIVRNTRSGRWLVGTSPDVPAMLNRVCFQLELGSYPNRELQADFSALGPDAFEIETLDLLEPAEDPDTDVREDLAELQEMWIDKLGGRGEGSYNPAKRG